jgi:hypothetical protein
VAAGGSPTGHSPFFIGGDMTYIDDLKTARDNIATLIKDITANPKPSYSIDGQTVQWAAYLRALTSQMEVIDKAINAGEPYEFETTATTGTGYPHCG